MLSYWKLGVLALGVSFVFAGPVFAEDNSEATETEVAETAQDESEMICRRIRTTGTRLTQRYCMTRAEWTSMREESQELVERSNMGGHTNTGSVGQ